MARLELVASEGWDRDKTRRKKIKIEKKNFYTNDCVRFLIFSDSF